MIFSESSRVYTTTISSETSLVLGTLSLFPGQLFIYYQGKMVNHPEFQASFMQLRMPNRLVTAYQIAVRPHFEDEAGEFGHPNLNFHFPIDHLFSSQTLTLQTI